MHEKSKHIHGSGSVRKAIVSLVKIGSEYIFSMIQNSIYGLVIAPVIILIAAIPFFTHTSMESKQIYEVFLTTIFIMFGVSPDANGVISITNDDLTTIAGTIVIYYMIAVAVVYWIRRIVGERVKKKPHQKVRPRRRHVKKIIVFAILFFYVLCGAMLYGYTGHKELIGVVAIASTVHFACVMSAFVLHAYAKNFQKHMTFLEEQSHGTSKNTQKNVNKLL